MLALRIVLWLERLAVQTGSAGKLKRRSLGSGSQTRPRRVTIHYDWESEAGVLGLLLSGYNRVCSVRAPGGGGGEEARVPQSELHEAQRPGACAGLCPSL